MMKYSLSALFLVFIVLDASEAIEFPGLELLISDCIETKCGVRMRTCLRTNEWELTASAKGCIARDCRNAIKLCVKQIPNDVLEYATTMAGIAEQYVDYIVDVFSDSYLLCWFNTDINNGTKLIDCVIDDGLKKMEPFINLIGSALFSDPAYMTCWVVHVGKVLTSYTTDADKYSDLINQIVLNKAIEAKRSPYEHMKCYSRVNMDGCINMWNRILGKPSWVKQQCKDILVAFIHDVISASVKCRKS